MLGVGRADEEVVGDVEQRHQRLEALRVAVGQLLRRDARALGGRADGLAVLVGAGEEEDVLAALALVAREHVGRDRRVRVAEMRRRVDVVDRRGDVERHGDAGYPAAVAAIRARRRRRARPATAPPGTPSARSATPVHAGERDAPRRGRGRRLGRDGDRDGRRRRGRRGHRPDAAGGRTDRRRMARRLRPLDERERIDVAPPAHRAARAEAHEPVRAHGSRPSGRPGRGSPGSHRRPRQAQHRGGQRAAADRHAGTAARQPSGERHPTRRTARRRSSRPAQRGPPRAAAPRRTDPAPR